jgi:hypothetical protein
MPRPDSPHPGRCLDTLTDGELRRLEKSATPATAAYIPAFPQSVMQAVVDADAVTALPLILAIHRQLVMTKREETPLNEAIWKRAGSPSSKRRESILRKLRTVPHVIRLKATRTRTSHYSVSRGEFWGEIPTPPNCFPELTHTVAARSPRPAQPSRPKAVEDTAAREGHSDAV